MLRRFWIGRLWIVVFAAASGPLMLRGDDPSPGNFDETVAPILIRRCLECHSGADPAGGLDLSSADRALAGGANGVVLVPGKPRASLIWELVQADQMPPDDPLDQEERALLYEWIEGGAAWGTDPLDPFRFTSNKRAGYDWWALQPLAAVDQPAAKQPQVRRGIDAFVLAKLAAQGLTPSPPADRRTLIRRLSFDLLGLPPTPAEVAAFLADSRPNAYEALVERMLASPHYGIRWARLWLDVARFGESQGFERDKIREDSWLYRDWLIHAFNTDMPYDDFARWQIAGDVLRPEHAAAVIATGFLVAGPYDEVGQKQQSDAMKAVVRQDELEDMVSVVGQTFLGLTINCARCHDHKFDPIRQREYYQLAAALDGVRHGSRTVRLDGAPDQAWEVPRAVLASGSEQLSTYAVSPKPPGVAHVLLRGNPATKGDPVAAGGVASLVGPEADFGLAPEASDAVRRVKLVQWVTAQANPLFSRVMVNRLWYHHFGRGLVETPNDFGFNGGVPQHSELLDYLAQELIRSQWSLKALHRLIVTSETYRQASRYQPRQAKRDAENRWLWRKSPRRLEAETLRDTVLSVAGELNEQMGGPGYRDFETFTHNTQFYRMKDPIGPPYHRRSIYRTWIRSGRNRLLDVFDCPDPSTKTPKRAVTVTPLQALALWNNSFVVRMSERLAERLEREAGSDAQAQLHRAYQLAFSRNPQEVELQEGVTFVGQHGLPEFCRVIMNSNEFLYVD